MLEVAMSDPDNVTAIDEIRRQTGYKVQPLRVADPEIAWAMDTYWTGDDIIEPGRERGGASGGSERGR
jgi:metal-sulfur cluster biosynthetic enzyme